MAKTVVLVILDGWGIGEKNDGNPIHVVNPESFKFLEENYPVTSILASGISIGLPWGETGNSEVGHLTLGAGKVLYQYYPKITMAIEDGTFFENPALKGAFLHAKKNNSGVNLVGLLTKANTHASLTHLSALLKMAEKEGVADVRLHLFADGLDSPPKTLENFLGILPQDKIASISGRYYGMDRNQNWQLVEKAYEVMTNPEIPVTPNLPEYISSIYKRNLSEEFLPPLKIAQGKEIKDDDSIVFFNFREDSIREISEAFISDKFDKFPRKDLQNNYIATLTRYEEKFENPVAFEADRVENPLGKVLSENGKTQLRLAESYKYAHVTYFFNGYEEAPYKGEYRVLVPSLNITHPDEKPELMASAVTDRLIESIQNGGFDFVLVNYSNPDTVGHTGNYDACLTAVKTIDAELARVLKTIEGTDTVLLITSDHGNIEQVINPTTGRMETQHDPNPVPFYLIAPGFKGRKFANHMDIKNETLGILSDVAPTVLELMGIPKPETMTGKSLLKELI